jgi:hypothetical protein
MRDDKLFFHAEHHWGVFDMDVRYKGQAHAFATRAVNEESAMEEEWEGRVWADLHDANIGTVTAYMQKAVATPSCKCVFLLKARPDTEAWHSFVIKYARAIYYLRGHVESDTSARLGVPLAIVEFYGTVKGSSLTYGWNTATMDDPPFERLAYLRRRAASER